MFKPIKRKDKKKPTKGVSLSEYKKTITIQTNEQIDMYPFNTKKYNAEIKICPKKIRDYFIFCDKKHPMAYRSTGHVYLHRHVAAIELGRWLFSHELVHHEDENKENNDPGNLRIVTTAEHNKEHGKRGRRK